MTFAQKVLKLINKFQMSKNYKPNELWLGFSEEQRLNKYIKEYLNTSPDSEINIYSNLPHKRKIEFMGLKVRFVDADYEFTVEYNPHYD